MTGWRGILLAVVMIVNSLCVWKIAGENGWAFWAAWTFWASLTGALILAKEAR